MNARTAKRLKAECLEAIRLDRRISFQKLWKLTRTNYLKTPAPEREKFSIFESASLREGGHTPEQL